MVDVRTVDNKDRWLARLDPATGALTVLDRQRDEAWVAGPGISWWGGGSAGGFLPDPGSESGAGSRYWFQSERTGWSHLYAVDLTTGAVEALTGAKVSADEEHLDPVWQSRIARRMRDIRLPARTVLARPNLSLADLMELKVGDVIPVTIGRALPLIVGNRIVAHGTIGEQDGRAAFQIEKLAQESEQ